MAETDCMTDTERQLVFLHIAKTGGHSFIAAAKKTLGGKVLHYSAEHDVFAPEDIKTRIRRALPQPARGFLLRLGVSPRDRYFDPTNDDISSFAIIEGHFSHTNIPFGLTDLPITSVIRHPLERVASHFAHLERNPKAVLTPKDFPIAHREGQLFTTFALQSGVTNLQTELLGSSSYGYQLGRTDRLTDFMLQLGLSEPGYKNAASYSEPNYDPGFVRDFEALNTRDYELFESIK